MRNQIEAADRLGLRAVTINSANRDDWALDRGRPRRGPDRRPVRVRAAVRERGLQRAAPAGDPALDRDVRGRRGALHQRLGPRVRARLPADRPAAAVARPRRARCWARRRRRTTGWSRTSRTSWATTWWSSAGRSRATRCTSTRSRCATRRSASPGSRSTCRRCPAPGSCTASRSPTPSASRAGCAAGASTPARTTRTSPPRSARRSRRPAREPAQGAGRDGRAGDGLRQARPRLRRPLPAPGLADRLLPAGGPGGPRRRERVRDPARRAARTTRSPSTSSSTAFPPTARMQDILAALEATDSATIKNLQAR